MFNSVSVTVLLIGAYKVFFSRLERPLVSLGTHQMKKKNARHTAEKNQKVPCGPIGPKIMYSNVNPSKVAHENNTVTPSPFAASGKYV